MPKLKEKPKSNKSGSRQRSQPALSSRQAAKLLRDKYLQQLGQRRPETDSTEAQASGQIEDAGGWAVDELSTHVPHSPRQQERNIRAAIYEIVCKEKVNRELKENERN